MATRTHAKWTLDNNLFSILKKTNGDMVLYQVTLYNLKRKNVASEILMETSKVRQAEDMMAFIIYGYDLSKRSTGFLNFAYFKRMIALRISSLRKENGAAALGVELLKDEKAIPSEEV